MTKHPKSRMTHLPFGAALLVLLVSSVSLHAASGSATYVYDNLGRIRTVTYDDGTVQSYAYDAAGNRTQISSEAISYVSISNTAPSASEGTGVSITVTRIGDTTSAISVNYATSNGTAQAGTNYTAASGSVSFATNVASVTIPLATLQDHLYNNSLTYSLTLSTSNPLIVLQSAVATITLTNVDPAPVFSITGTPSLAEGGAASYTVTRTNASGLTHAINYATAAGTAVDGTDYTGTSGTLTFTGNTTPTSMQNFPVQTISSTVYDGSRTYNAALNTPTNGAGLGTSSVTTTITDINVPPSFAINSPAVVQEGNPITFTVTKTGSTRLTHQVSFAAASGTAILGTDFSVATASPLVFGASTTANSITVNTVNNAVNLPNKTFTMSLSGPTNGATVGTATGTGTISIVNSNVPPGVPGVVMPRSWFSTTVKTVTLSWGAASGSVTRYELLSTNPRGVQTTAYSGTALTTPLTITAGEWTADVRACNASGCSAYTGSPAQLTYCPNGNC
jgi:YD repeat-containing protein